MSSGKFLETLAGTHFPTPPIWLMRQAGRYLPEYRAVRATTKSFLEFCYTPEKAVEVTLQPIRRFGLDAAIIFSDILVVPDALGQKVWFAEGEGPKLEALTDPAQFGQLSRARLTDYLAPVYSAISATRKALPKETALLGFAGAPFTLACYMIEGGGSKDFAKVKLWAYRHPELLRASHRSAGRLGRRPSRQSGRCRCRRCPTVRSPGQESCRRNSCSAGRSSRWCASHTACARVIPRCRSLPSHARVGPAALMYRRPDVFSALSIDTGIGAHWAAQKLQPHILLQGNLDPDNARRRRSRARARGDADS